MTSRKTFSSRSDFDNLLPEAGARDRLARRLNAGSIDAFDLLSRFGRETAGAITISDHPDPAPDDDAYRPLTPQEPGERSWRWKPRPG